jgi:hypothetical protein
MYLHLDYSTDVISPVSGLMLALPYFSNTVWVNSFSQKEANIDTVKKSV